MSEVGFPAKDREFVVDAHSLLTAISRVKVEGDATRSYLADAFAQLERLAGSIRHRDAPQLLSDPTICALLPKVYAVRAEFEYAQEDAAARAALADSNSAQSIERHVAAKVTMLPRKFFDALGQRDPILFAGSGPFPTTAMAIAGVTGRSVTCLDRNADANALARRFADAGGFATRLSFLDGRLEDFTELADYACIVGAFLLGVGNSAEPGRAKTCLVERTANALAPGARLLLRTPVGAGGLIYPVVRPELPVGFKICPYLQDGASSLPYDRPFLLIERLASGVSDE
ncbi:MAG: hypothetical protein Kilf2KO_24300 [Rhodospirillales bacterium]